MAFAASPLLIMPLVAAPDLAGAVALAIRLFDVPTQIIIAATTPVLMNRLRASDSAAPVFGRLPMAGFSGLVSAAYAALALAFFAALPWLKDTIFGGLAPVVVPVAIFQGALTVAGPLAEACALYRRQTALTLIHLAALGASGLALAVASLAGPIAGLALSLARGSRPYRRDRRAPARALDRRARGDRPHPDRGAALGPHQRRYMRRDGFRQPLEVVAALQK